MCGKWQQGGLKCQTKHFKAVQRSGLHSPRAVHTPVFCLPSPAPCLWVLSEEASVFLPASLLSRAPAAAGKQRRCQHTGCELPERQCLVSSLYPQPSTFPSCQWSVLWVLPCVTRPSCLIPTVRCLQQLICPESAIYSQDPGQMCTYYYENTKK